MIGVDERDLLPKDCRACGLYESAHRWAIPPADDPRTDLPEDAPWILVVGNAPSSYDDTHCTHFGDPSGGGEFLRDYLHALDVHWTISSAVLCYPGVRKKPSAEQSRLCASAFTGDIYADKKYKCIICLGAAAMTAVMGKQAPRSLSAAGKAPIEVEGLPPVLVGPHPINHLKWEQGRGGQDLTDDYFRMFEMAEKIAHGTYVEERVDYVHFRDASKALTYFRHQKAERCYFDCETNTWDGIPDQQTIWHPNAKLVCLCITYVHGTYPDLTYETVALSGPALTKNVLYYAFIDRRCGAHNLIFDVNALWKLADFDLYAVAKEAFCTMVDYFIRNSAVSRIGLKEVGPLLLGVPDWSIVIHGAIQLLYQHQEERNKEIREAVKLKSKWDNFLDKVRKQGRLPKPAAIPTKDKILIGELCEAYQKDGIQGVIRRVERITHGLPWDEELGDKRFSIGDVTLELVIEYCCKDTWTTARIGEEKLYISQEESGMPSPPPSEFTRNYFKDLIWFLAHLERYGLPASKARFEELRELYYDRVQNGCKDLLAYSAVRSAIEPCSYYVKATKKRDPEQRFSIEDPPADLTDLVNTKSKDFNEGLLRRTFVCVSLGSEPTHFSISVPWAEKDFINALINLPSHVLRCVGPLHWEFRQDFLDFVMHIAEEVYGVENVPHLQLTKTEGISFGKEAIMPWGHVKSPERNVYVDDDTVELSTANKIWRLVFWVNIWRGILSRDIGQYVDYVVDGVLRTSFRPVKADASPLGRGADSLGGGSISRVQSTPNIQNFKDDAEFRSVFDVNVNILHTNLEPEEWFCELDFSTIEPRTLAFVANISKWKEYFSKGLDIYRVLCNEVDGLGVDVSGDPAEVSAVLKEKVPKVRRNLYKQQVLAIMYERGPASFAAAVGISYDEAVAFFAKFNAAYPEIEAWKQTIRDAVMSGNPVTNLYGRRVIYDYRGDDATLAAIVRSAINFGIQASGSCDIPASQLIRVLKMLLRTGRIEYAKPRNFVHDAGWFTFTNHIIGFQTIALCKRIMTDYTALPVEGWDVLIPVGGKLGTNPGNMTEELFAEKFNDLDMTGIDEEMRIA